MNVTDSTATNSATSAKPGASASGANPPQPEPVRSRRWTSLWQQFLVKGIQRAERRIQRMRRAQAMRLGERLGRLAFRLAERPRHFALHNLQLAYGDTLSPAERSTLTRRVFENFGKTAIDFIRSPLIRTPEDLAALVPVSEGWEEYVKPVVAEGRPVIFVGAHMGNWEMLGRWIAAQGVRLTVVAREPHDAAFGGWVRSVREGAGFSVANKGDSVKRLLSTLKRGETLGVLPDQNSGDVFVPFFGTPAGTVAGPALLSMKTGASLIPSYCLRRADDTYRILFLPPIPAESTGNQEADVYRIMFQINEALEGVIREHPDQWLWLHNRWKSAFEEKNRDRWPSGYSQEEARVRWAGSREGAK